MEKECGQSNLINKYEPYGTDLDTFYFIYAETTNPDDILQNLSLLKGYLVAINFDESFTEIYDVCVAKDFRNRGISSKLLQAVKKSTYNILWLGITLDNPLWDYAIEVTLNLDFLIQN